MASILMVYRSSVRSSRAAVRPRRAAPAARAWPGSRQRAQLTVRRLAQIYPAACELEHRDPFQLLVATILSAQTTDRRVNQVTPELFRRYPDAAALARAEPEAVERIIQPTGFFRVKARTLIACSRQLLERFGGQVPRRMEDLVTLPGVGRKTANVVLGVAFDIPGFAVDTHVIRLTNRLRLTRSRDPVRIEQDVCAIVPKADWTGLSLRLILHGRRICVARTPRCPQCVLDDFCPTSSTRRRGRRRGQTDSFDRRQAGVT